MDGRLREVGLDLLGDMSLGVVPNENHSGLKLTGPGGELIDERDASVLVVHVLQMPEELSGSKIDGTENILLTIVAGSGNARLVSSAVPDLGQVGIEVEAGLIGKAKPIARMGAQRPFLSVPRRFLAWRCCFSERLPFKV